MTQGRNSIHGIYVIFGMGAIAALLMVGSGHVAIPFSFKDFNYGFTDDYYAKYSYNKYHDDDDDDDDDDGKRKHKAKDRDDDDDDDGKRKHSKPHYQPSYQPSYQPYHQPYPQSSLTLLKQEALNICLSNIADKSKIKIEAKDGALIEITCSIIQTQTALQAPPIDPIQDATNICGANVKGKFTVKPSGNKLEIKAKDGAMIYLTCTITQTQSFGTGDPLLIQKADNLCGSNVGSKNKLEIKAKDGSAVVINCQITQTQTVGQGPPVDPIQDSMNICGSNVGYKNKIKLEAKDGSSVVISCESNQTQTIGLDPFLFQESTNVCGTSIGDKNSIKIKAKDGSAVVISCENSQMQNIGFVP